MFDQFDLDVRFGEPVPADRNGFPPTTNSDTCTDSHMATCGSACCNKSRSCL
jgi:hypothetical protein